MNELLQWYDRISAFERLNITEAKALYRKAINTQNETFMNKLILGTLYVVYEYIKRNGLELFVSSSYDMNDIISSFNEVWIKKLYNGDLLNVDSYSVLFNSPYFNEVYNNLCGDEIIVLEQFDVSAYCFVELLTLYVSYRNKELNKPFSEVIKEKFYTDRWDSWPHYTYDSVVNTISLLERICNNFNFDKRDDLNLGKTKIINYLRLIINIGLMEPISNEIPDENDMEDNILRDNVFKNFIKDIDEILTDDRERKIIHEIFGLDGNDPLYFETVGNLHGISRGRVKQIETKAIKKIRKSNNIRKYNDRLNM